MTTPAIEIPGYIAGTWDLDPVHSHIGFAARHMMVSKVRGRFDTFEAQIVTAEDPLQSAATATVDMNSVNTTRSTSRPRRRRSCARSSSGTAANPAPPHPAAGRRQAPPRGRHRGRAEGSVRSRRDPPSRQTRPAQRKRALCLLSISKQRRRPSRCAVARRLINRGGRPYSRVLGGQRAELRGGKCRAWQEERLVVAPRGSASSATASCSANGTQPPKVRQTRRSDTPQPTTLRAAGRCRLPGKSPVFGPEDSIYVASRTTGQPVRHRDTLQALASLSAPGRWDSHSA